MLLFMSAAAASVFGNVLSLHTVIRKLLCYMMMVHYMIMWHFSKVFAEPLCQSLLLPSSLLVFTWGLLSVHFPLNNGCDSSCFYIYSVYSYGDNLTVVYIPHYSVMVICIRIYWIIFLQSIFTDTVVCCSCFMLKAFKII